MYIPRPSLSSLRDRLSRGRKRPDETRDIWGRCMRGLDITPSHHTHSSQSSFVLTTLEPTSRRGETLTISLMHGAMMIGFSIYRTQRGFIGGCDWVGLGIYWVCQVGIIGGEGGTAGCTPHCHVQPGRCCVTGHVRGLDGEWVHRSDM